VITQSHIIGNNNQYRTFSSLCEKPAHTLAKNRALNGRLISRLRSHTGARSTRCACCFMGKEEVLISTSHYGTFCFPRGQCHVSNPCHNSSRPSIIPSLAHNKQLIFFHPAYLPLYIGLPRHPPRAGCACDLGLLMQHALGNELYH
jgi:hypothetical protein